ncbi:formate--tetrahydrofolate ligase [Lactobacillus sanfranciscensis]|uniref:Formate--tetrahydrofolate ligase n=1 Tax=Fructilactobacillus sanfranciscensis (strain TMW 1.1304) TaxID=714313 RepID=G2KVI8_FRUST|nr:formate--tetrahydrofolate ligase [Fructilactobacillus sanfranciscensis]AEN99003.1 Formate--tetrahydrofolate ligase [Fructilactobacillus sanfranciscensis TMW 1.1304]NDR75522.1 formate--tetrahydrofolate ligase [Fructilactobacillus sanfranciscensis]NDR96279.1 formate--tetrahydrofolate ligase [Fructilactobacillus sanfranciscensis]NDS04056.1 formate--tetrahydrofolate ligase [Fructilactobacillus sanfranciscensis]POH19115.1 formate--tetrahydrofolate ligase [Fructilactobacillus sanfranciscensis]
MKSDIEIAQAATIWPIEKVAKAAGFTSDEVIPYGKNTAKIVLDEKLHDQENGKLVLVTSINPTPAGEGKSTVAVGLADALNLANHKTVLALREPSLGPVMGMKGGATGGGMSQVLPMDDINLHFTGDFHALTVAQNTLMALVDNSIYQGNKLNLDPRQVLLKRVLDVNDRELRHIVVGLGGRTSGVPRESGFDITAASELMAILTLSTDLDDMQRRINRIVVGYTYDKKPVTVADLGVVGAITTLLKDAIKPNLVQTMGHTPTLIHGGPFANIAQGTNSVQATKLAMKMGDYAVTEAGFGADLGGEKFLDVKTPLLPKYPDAIVIVATVRALKMHGGMDKKDLNHENLVALQKGLANLGQHISSMKRYGVPVVVAINKFTSDTDAEMKMIEDYSSEQGVKTYAADVWGQGGQGATDLAAGVVEATEQPADFKPLYQPDDSIMTKLNQIVKVIYGGKEVELSPKAQKQIAGFEKLGWDKLPVIVAKTQYSLTDDAKKIGKPEDFVIHIREFVPKLGAGFLVAMAGNILTMPGLPKDPAANHIKIDSDEKITGLF